jgi:hypothetical protein
MSRPYIKVALKSLQIKYYEVKVSRLRKLTAFWYREPTLSLKNENWAGKKARISQRK